MTRLLLIIATAFMLFSCKKHDVEPAPQPQAGSNSSTNRLPMKITWNEAAFSEFSYYPNNLLKSVVNHYTDNTTSLIEYAYTTNGKVLTKKTYQGTNLSETLDFTYNTSDKINLINITNLTEARSSKYTYYYTNTNETNYVLVSDNNNANIVTDSIAIRNNEIIQYRRIINPTSANPETTPNGFFRTDTSPYYITPSGVFTESTTSSNISIDFQDEVAENLPLNIGNLTYQTYFDKPAPRKYCLTSGLSYTYGFDGQNRLTTISLEYTRYGGPNNAPMGPVGISATIVY